MKFIKALFLFGFILLHSKLGNNPIWFKTDYIVTVSKNTVYGGSTVRTINDSEGFVIKEEPNIKINKGKLKDVKTYNKTRFNR